MHKGRHVRFAHPPPGCRWGCCGEWVHCGNGKEKEPGANWFLKRLVPTDREGETGGCAEELGWCPQTKCPQTSWQSARISVICCVKGYSLSLWYAVSKAILSLCDMLYRAFQSLLLVQRLLLQDLQHWVRGHSEEPIVWGSPVERALMDPGGRTESILVDPQ